MKRIGLFLLIFFVFCPIIFADNKPDGGVYNYSGWLTLHNISRYSGWGQYTIYYDMDINSMVIRISYGTGPLAIYSVENANPKLFATVKDSIDKHLNSYSSFVFTPGTTTFNIYGNISFWYKTNTSLGLNEIKGVAFKASDGQWNHP